MSYEDVRRKMDVIIAKGGKTPDQVRYIEELKRIIPLMEYFHQRCEGVYNISAIKQYLENEDSDEWRSYGDVLYSNMSQYNLENGLSPYRGIERSIHYRRYDHSYAMKLLRKATKTLSKCVGLYIHRHATEKVLQKEYTRLHPGEYREARRALERHNLQDAYPLVAKRMYENAKLGRR